jgi:hypothetical protein
VIFQHPEYLESFICFFGVLRKDLILVLIRILTVKKIRVIVSRRILLWETFSLAQIYSFHASRKILRMPQFHCSCQ